MTGIKSEQTKTKIQQKSAFSVIDLDSAVSKVIKIAQTAGVKLKQQFLDRNYTLHSKGGVDFATNADDEADAYIREQLQQYFPGASFLTEETAPSDYSSLAKTENLWIIDPLDGTTNFSRQMANFGVSIALVDRAVTKLAVVYVPMTAETYWTHADQEHAYLGELPIKVSTTSNFAEAVAACDWAWNLKKRLNVVRWLNVLCTKVRTIKAMGSAVADLASLAAGRFDVYVHSGLKPWDVAAVSLLIEKAGGQITTPSGGAWNVFEQDMLATNRVLHPEMVKLLASE